ncbi:MAG: DUF2577 domain-containing protein [Roseburia sp.]|nr:DUF2577 domain-containing protein [Roseburia sp.]
MNAFLSDVKRAAVEAVKAGKPFSFMLGKVTGVSPLKIQVDQKLELAASQLILTNAVRDYTVSMTVDHQTESALTTHTHSYSGATKSGGSDSHTHGYEGTTDPTDLSHVHSFKGTKVFRVHLGLKAGEHVILLQIDGGKKFIVLDRVEAPA